MIQMPELPEEARRCIVEMDSATLVELFDHCIATDELAVADYILNNLMATLDQSQQEQIWAIMQRGAAAALTEALSEACVQ